MVETTLPQMVPNTKAVRLEAHSSEAHDSPLSGNVWEKNEDILAVPAPELPLWLYDVSANSRDYLLSIL